MDAPSPPHPTDHTLHAYGLGKLDDMTAESVNAHLESCPACRRRTAEMSSDSFLSRFRDGQSTDGLDRPVPGQSLAGSAAPFPVGTLPPELADHKDYEVVRELGRGGMGVVYLVRNRLMGRNEVLKVMGRHLVERPEVSERFLREIRAVASLRHPNIVAAHHAFHVGGSIAFTMEYVEGYDLSKMVKARGPLPVAHACLFAHQAALGLQHAHEEGMVHRDIKPGNLMVSRRGEKAIIKVLDFGLAKAAREGQFDSALTHAGQMLGTPDFIAPEQSVDATSADIRADIYSLGCTLYYLLTGGPPFRAMSLYDLLQAHHSIDAKLLNFVRPEVPTELATLVAKMMAKEPERRFPTPASVSEALAPFYKKGNPTLRPATPEVSRATAPGARRPIPAPEPAPTEPASATPAAPESRTSTESPRPEEMWASLVDSRDKDSEVGAAVPSPVVSGSMRKPPWMSRTAVATASLFGAVALGIIITITIRIGKDDDEAVTPKDAGAGTGGSPINGSPARTPAAEPPVPRAADPKLAETRPRPAQADDASGFEPLFNRKDLSGWTFPLGHESDWTVEGETIRALGDDDDCSVMATSRGDFGDFHLRMEARVSDSLNNRIFIRFSPSISNWSTYAFQMGPPSDPGRVNMLGQLVIKENGGPHDFSRVGIAGLRTITKPTVPGLTQNTWQLIEIVANGNIFTMKVDGREVSAFEDTFSRLRRGQIAIRLTPQSQIEIRKIEIKGLSKEASVGTGGLPTSVDDRSDALVGKSPVSPDATGTTGTTMPGMTGMLGIEPNAELVAFYDFDDATATDRTGHGHHGILSENPPSLTREGYEGGALSFNPEQKNCVVVPVDINPSVMPQITMGGWFKTNVVEHRQVLMTHDDASFARNLDIDSRGGPGIRWSAFNGHGVLGGEPVMAGRWTFVAMRHDQTASKLVLDVDGNQVTDKAYFGLARDWLFLGKHPKNGGYFDGAIDNIFIYKGFLSDAKIADIRARGRAAILPASKSKPDTGSGAGDALQPGTIWTGQNRDMSENPVGPWAVTLQVIERNGETIVFLLEATGWRRKIKGKVAGDRIWWNRADVEVLLGNVWGFNASGTIRGDEMTWGYLNYVTKDGRLISGAVTLKKR